MWTKISTRICYVLFPIHKNTEVIIRIVTMIHPQTRCISLGEESGSFHTQLMMLIPDTTVFLSYNIV